MTLITYNDFAISEFCSTRPGFGSRIAFMNSGAPVISRLRAALAFALVFWCAGAGCMAVSYARAASMNAASLSSEKHPADKASSMGAHACCKARHSSSRASSSQTDSDLFGFQEAALPGPPVRSDASSCCPLTSGSFVTSSGTEVNQDNSSTTNHSESFLLRSIRFTPTDIARRLPDQNQTYLRCCAFLI